VRVWKITEVNYGAGSFGFAVEDYPDWFGAESTVAPCRLRSGEVFICWW
jgi:hypothetical protein